MPFDTADFDWRGNPMPSRPRHWLWGLLDSFKEMALVLVVLIVAFSVAFAMGVLLYGLPDLPSVGTDISKFPSAPIGSQIVTNGSFFLVLAGFGWWRVHRIMAE